MLAAEALHVSLSGRPVLAGIDLALQPGVVTVVAGPNGAGKSTLLKALTGLLRPASGRVSLDGRPLAEWPARLLAQRRAVLAQSQHVGFPFTVFEMVALGAGAASAGTPATRALVAACLAAVDLDGYGGRLVQELSGGEQQRVHFARVLCQLGGPPAARSECEPRWMFLDEPTAGLDLAHQLGVLDVARAHARVGGGVLAILHDLNLASLYADRLLLVSAGHIVGDGPPADILAAPLLREVFGPRLRVITEDGRPYILPTHPDEARA